MVFSARRGGVSQTSECGILRANIGARAQTRTVALKAAFPRITLRMTIWYP
jgi:hypothetical protein